MKNKKEEKRFSTVSLPTVLVEKIKEQIKGTGFTSVSSYVEFVMREIIALGKTKGKKEAKEGVKAKLKALGYM